MHQYTYSDVDYFDADYHFWGSSLGLQLDANGNIEVTKGDRID